MFHRTCGAVAVALLVVGAHGCATSRAIPALPPVLGEQGLLVARLYVLGMQGIETASINVDGKLKDGALREGYVALPLPPGEHVLNEVRAAGQLLGSAMVERESPVRPARGGAPTFIYIPSYTQSVIHYTTLSVNRTFKIEAGRVTNLGLIVYVPVKDPAGTQRAQVDGSKQFRVFALDNGAEVRDFLETNYPELTAKLQDREPVLAPYKYLDPAKLPELRRTIAYFEQRGPHTVASPTRKVVFGRGGTLVGLSEGPTRDQPKVEVLDTGTLADVVGGVRQGERFTFVTSNAQVLTWDGQALVRAALPGRVQPVALAALGDRGLAVVDNHLRILTAAGPGGPWTPHDGLVTSVPRSDLRIAADARGAFLALGVLGVPSRIYYLEVGAAPVSIVPPMPDPNVPLTGPYFMAARPAGLFVFHFDAPTLFFRSSATGTWARQKLPASKCDPTSLDEDGRAVTVKCGGATYRSGDSGATWSSPAT